MATQDSNGAPLPTQPLDETLLAHGSTGEVPSEAKGTSTIRFSPQIYVPAMVLLYSGCMITA
ncbi:hypothetical protein BDV12DRAFT_174917 [Aspergillus spectabilis]